MGLGLKETLRKLCCSNGWSYGVFWGFAQRNSKLLTVEDSYCEEEMGAIVKNMLLQVQMLGEGIIGQAALSGKNQWIFSDSNNGGRSSSGSEDMPQDDSKIQWQFSYGLKTVAVIPVDSRGVIQFGSTHKILETSEFLDQTKRLFNEVEDINGFTLSENPSSSLNYENCDLNEWFASFCNGNITPMSSGTCNNLMEIANFEEKVEPLCVDSTGFTSNAQLYSQSAFSVENLASEVPCMGTWSNEGSILTSMGIQDSSFPPFEGGLLEREMGGLGEFHEEFKVDGFGIQPSNCFVADNLFEWFTAGANSVSNSLTGDVAKDNPFTQPANSVQSSITDAYVCGGKQQVSMHMKDVGTDPLKGFGVEYGNMKPRGSSGHLAVTSGVSECISELDVNSVNGLKKGLFSELGLEELLNGSTNSSIDDRFSNAKRRRLESSSVDAGSISCSGGSSTTTMQHPYHKDNETSLLLKKDIFPKSQVGLWIDDSYSINNGPAAVLAKLKKHDEPTKATRKRAKPGESTRPRPKDRQQIQDRMKELKELIPDGGKCSIDALLDRTIKYMLFLQSVTKYADKIKQVDEPKLIGEAKRKIPNENTSGNGVTWAIEVGDESMVCPIIVEDLSPPGLMLIEMLCEDQGFFLEIADVIRGFGLNVIKGEMETRDDKIWARFIVEAKTNIRRIDIFWSLVQLLQLTSTTGMDSTNQQSIGTNTRNFQQSPLPCPISVAETHQ